jgi:hypothetical protein
MVSYAKLLISFHYRKRHSFIGVFNFVDTDEYIQIIFIGFEIDKYNFIVIGGTETDEYMGHQV